MASNNISKRLVAAAAPPVKQEANSTAQNSEVVRSRNSSGKNGKGIGSDK